jgi:hypothetical protein
MEGIRTGTESHILVWEAVIGRGLKDVRGREEKRRPLLPPCPEKQDDEQDK